MELKVGILLEQQVVPAVEVLAMEQAVRLPNEVLVVELVMAVLVGLAVELIGQVLAEVELQKLVLLQAEAQVVMVEMVIKVPLAEVQFIMVVVAVVVA